MKYDPSPILADEYRALLRRKEWTHVAAGKVLGVTDRTSKAYARDGVPSGLASLAIRVIMEFDGVRPEVEQNAAAYFSPTGDATEARLRALDDYCTKLERAQYDLVARAEKAERRVMGLLKTIRQAAGALLIKGDVVKARDGLINALDENAPEPR